jgi:adenylate cyclase class IV
VLIPVQLEDIRRVDRHYYNRFLTQKLANPLPDAKQLEMLGMLRLCQVEKTRETYQHPNQDGASVVIDHIAGVGAFVETEGLTSEAAETEALLASLEQQLGLDTCSVVCLPDRDLVLRTNGLPAKV